MPFLAYSPESVLRFCQLICTEKQGAFVTFHSNILLERFVSVKPNQAFYP